MQSNHLLSLMQVMEVIDETIGEHNRVEGDYVFFVSGDDYRTFDGVDVNFNNVPASTNRGDFEDRDPVNNAGGSAGSGTVLDIPEIDLELKSEAIVAKTRKLKAVWTPELKKTLTLTIQLTLKLN